MTDQISQKHEAWTSIVIFLLIATGLSALAHFAIVRLYPASIYVGGLMWCPALAAFLTLRLRGQKISSLPWQWGDGSQNLKAYGVPLAYITIAYLAIWSLGFGSAPNLEQVSEWSSQLGLPSDSVALTLIVMIALLGTIQLIKSLGTIAGEEIGWRGFFIWRLREVMSFEATAIVSGLVWAAWHYPIIIAYGGGDPAFQIACFTLMIVSMSVILAYFTFRSRSLWPAVFFHAAHNLYIQKVFTPLTVENDRTALWIDEYGLMVPVVVTVFALVYWRKARAEGL